ncbi:MAG TPA: prolipoprotein diacylglyceryl transferase [Blastocatellia bacterium]|nr:prolipoprotein diacylglyceryl transferase [Blastocatellia bacterium]HMV84769.1 prolipoprotein diacylglyceryl transferase [Blastocatellia bacterium]HMX25636.1 prolipoprotein diacylglyceryl transferase [Blastocatellia bacterium]HMY70219.1 prolipoprotein diacylglyceryl transferase [Blastocatellia bacterium]HMZ19305.1 prolipoprotein diacylglyceryl transferase [Blastocatellia bacterium]
MFPELFKIPYLNFTIYTYGLLVALSFIVGLWVMARLAARDGLDKQKVYDLGLWVLVASLVGSKLLMIVTEWDERYRGNLGAIFTLDFLRSNGVFYGGFLGAVIASVIVMRIYKMPWWRTADAFAPGIAIGHFIGRLGCFSAGCCWGKPTAAWCGVHFTEKGHETTGVPTIVEHLDPVQQNVWADRLGSLTASVKLHPTQLYEAAALLVIFLVLLWMFGRRKFYGQIVLAYALLYSVARFTVEFWRDDPRGEVWGLSTSQFIAVVLFVGALAGFILKMRSGGQSAIRNPQSAI